MKHLRSFLFIGIIFLLVGLIYFVTNQDLIDNNKTAYDLNDKNIVNSAMDSISRIENVIDTIGEIIPIFSTQVEDFEAKADINSNGINLQIFKSHQLIFEKRNQILNGKIISMK